MRFVAVMVLLLLPHVASALTLRFSWEEVTTAEDGTPLKPLYYNLYRRAEGQPYRYKFPLGVAMTPSYEYEPLAPGKFFFVVRAVAFINGQRVESKDSNEVMADLQLQLADKSLEEGESWPVFLECLGN